MQTIITEHLKYSWLMVLVGISIMFLSIWFFITPISLFNVLAFYFQLIFFISGLVQFGFLLVNKAHLSHWEWYVIPGVIDIFLALILFVRPDLGTEIFPIYVGYILLFRSIIAVGISNVLEHSSIVGSTWVMIGGVLGVAFSLLMIWNTLFDGIGARLYAGCNIFFIGCSLLALGLTIKKRIKTVQQHKVIVHDVLH